jgi:hypothetical protein
MAMRHFVELDMRKIDYYVSKQLGLISNTREIETVMSGAFYARFLDECHRNNGFIKFLMWLHLATRKSSESGSLKEHDVFTLIVSEFYKQLNVPMKPHLKLVDTFNKDLIDIYGEKWFKFVSYDVEDLMCLGISDPTVAGKYAIAKQVKVDSRIRMLASNMQMLGYSSVFDSVNDFLKNNLGVVRDDLNIRCVPCESNDTADYMRFLDQLEEDNKSWDVEYRKGQAEAVNRCRESFSSIFYDTGLLFA